MLPGVARESGRKANKHHSGGNSTDPMRRVIPICEEGGQILDSFGGSRINTLIWPCRVLPPRKPQIDVT